MNLRPVSMDFNYGIELRRTLALGLRDAAAGRHDGDATLYTRQDMVEASWAVVEPIQNVWREHAVSSFPTTPPEPGARPIR